jgi:hypothetical protein
MRTYRETEVCISAPAALSAGKQPQVPIVYEIRRGPQSLSERHEEGKDLFLLPEMEPSLLFIKPSRYTDCLLQMQGRKLGVHRVDEKKWPRAGICKPTGR